MSNIRFYEVGGAVRDRLLCLPVKDVDFTVEAPSYESMRDRLIADGFRIYQERPEFVTIRAAVPAGSPLRERTKDADFVLARKDGTYTDGRRPDFVTPGTITDDLLRRDFTVNAIAMDCETGALIDPVEGQDDLMNRRLRFVGSAMARIEEDGLRVLRGFRFMVTRHLTPTAPTRRALHSREAAQQLSRIPVERIREELEKMFSCNTIDSMRLLAELPDFLLEVIFRDNLRLAATLKSS